MMKRVIKIFFWIVGIAGLAVLVGFIETEHKKITCKNIEVSIDYRGAAPLIDTGMIQQDVIRTYDSIIGKKIADINKVDIENHIDQNVYVENAEVYSTLTGNLKIRVTQKAPLFRVMNAYGQSFYIDRKGTAFPSKTGYSSRVLVINGNIPYKYSDTLDLIKNENFPLLKDLYNLVLYINGDDFLKAQIEQVFVNDDHEFELIPKVGRQMIIFGGIDDMKEKFDKLELFYQTGMKKAGWGTYKTINLKFKDQVVCAKK